MFNVVSRSALGGYMLIAEQVAKALFGAEYPEGTITTMVDALYTVVSSGLLIWGLVSRKDLDFGLFRK